MKVTLLLPAGSSLVLEGTPAELSKALGAATLQERGKRIQNVRAAPPAGTRDRSATERINAIVETIESRSDWALVEQKLMGSQIGRVLLCLEAAAATSDPWLSSKEIELITDGIGAKIDVANVSKTIREKARGLVVSEKQTVSRFKIKQRGLILLKELLKR